MFKDFQRRLQRDIKKRVDARVSASESKSGSGQRVSPSYLWIFRFINAPLFFWRFYLFIDFLSISGVCI